MQALNLDMYMTAGVGVVALLLGLFFTRSLPLLKKLCIPAPVSGGLAVSLATLLCHALLGLDFDFDGTVKDICMMLFFTSVGFQSNLRVLKQGGKPLLVMIGLVAILIVIQNLLSVGIAKGLQLNPLLGMATGSIPMSGGHGTAGGFSPVLEKMGLTGASSINMAAATFGLVAGSLIGGPVGEMLIRRHRLAKEAGDSPFTSSYEKNASETLGGEEHMVTEDRSLMHYTEASCILLLTMALGMGLSKLLALTGITFPTYFGALIVGAVLRNCFEGSGSKEKLRLDEIVAIGNICLSLFLGMAMATLKLWELSGLMLPLLVILLSQAAFMVLYACFVAFPALGKNYDAAVLVSGLCGFGLGATPNAMANMSAVCFKYQYAVKPFIIVPIIGAMFVDIINTGVITVFLNLL
ncbi:MAG: sodium/glutamate symporter [Bacteroidales bacterium]|nr:sodium/glutamate symporter [Bacteroidales bacterium]